MDQITLDEVYLQLQIQHGAQMALLNAVQALLAERRGDQQTIVALSSALELSRASMLATSGAQLEGFEFAAKALMDQLGQ